MTSTTRLQQIQEMLSKEPQDSFLRYALALEYGKSGDTTKAISLIEALLVDDTNYLGAYYQLGKYYEQIGQPEQAIAAYQKGVVIAQQQNNKKTERELADAIWQLED